MRQLMTRVRFGVCLLLLTALGGCAAGQGGAGLGLLPQQQKLSDVADCLRYAAPPDVPLPRELQKTAMPVYVIQPSDVLLIEPTDIDSPLRIAADQTVLPDGTIDLGRYGRPVVVGRTLEEIEVLVEATIDAADPENELDDVDVNVRLINPESAVFYVLGEVNSPGSYPYAGRETVLDAILVAGGLTSQADQCDIILTRPSAPEGCRTVLPICYRDIVQVGDSTTNYQIMPGDRIFVATRPCWEGMLPCCGNSGCDLCRPMHCACDLGGLMQFFRRENYSTAMPAGAMTVQPLFVDPGMPMPPMHSEPIAPPAAPPSETPYDPATPQSEIPVVPAQIFPAPPAHPHAMPSTSSNTLSQTSNMLPTAASHTLPSQPSTFLPVSPSYPAVRAENVYRVTAAEPRSSGNVVRGPRSVTLPESGWQRR